jgi:hypothetical protein
MGAGQFPAGVDGGAGEDPATDPPAARTVTLPAALQFDGRTGDYLTDASGRYKSSHPVDQRVALKMLVKRGKIPSASTLGSSFAEINRLSAEKRATRAQQIVRTNLADDVSAGDIEIVDIRVDTSNQYATLVALDYINLRLPHAVVQTATTSVI